MAKTIIQVESKITQEAFIDECLSLNVPGEVIPLLTKKAFPALGVEYIEILIAKRKEQKDETRVLKEKVKVLKEKGKSTIHSVIMDGLRLGQDNPTIIANLVVTFPDIVEQKLKQRMYEYRSHFTKGKIK